MNSRLGCASVWGGIENINQEVECAALSASLFSKSADGGKGGDIYFFSVCGGDRLARIAVADVVGHGKTVSDVSGWVYQSLKDHLNNPAGDQVIRNLNNTVEKRGFQAMTTIVLASIVLRDDHLYFTYGGHPPMMIWRGQTGVWAPVSPPETVGCNLPLGVLANACYDQSQIPIEPGDRIFIYTDGVLEAPSPDGEFFGEERLIKSLNQAAVNTPVGLKESVLHAIKSHTGGTTEHDDITLLAVEARV